MKKFKVLFFMMIAIFMFTTGCTAQETYNEKIIKQATEITFSMGFEFENYNPFADDSRYFTVDKTAENQFLVDVNGTEMTILLPEVQHRETFLPTEQKELSGKNKKIVKNSKKMVIKYIEQSNILQNKEEIIQYIKNLPAKESTFTNNDSVGAYFDEKNNCIYVNHQNSKYICEWMITHELIHAVAFATHGYDIQNETYPFNLFNEILTDWITSSLNPDSSKNIQSGYLQYYHLIAPYLYMVGEKAIEAYFYDYEIIYNVLPKEEFDFYVLVIENYGAENSEAYFNNLMFKWAAGLVQ